MREKGSQDQDERERRGEQQRGNLYRRSNGRNRLSNGRVIERYQNREYKERKASSVCRVPHGPIPTEEEQNSTGHVPRELDKDLRCNPSRPTVHLARPFPDLTDHPVHDERYLKLLSTGDGQDEHDKDREQLVLNALLGARTLPECETDEKTRGDVQDEFGRDVGGIAPDGSRAASSHNGDLMNPRGRVFGMAFRFDGGSVSSLGMNSLDFLSGGGGFGRFLPNIMPVDRRSGGSTGADNVKHKLSPIVGVSMC